jgi:hypothetical protein
VASKTVSRRRDVELASILDSPEINQFIDKLESARWTGRPGYTVRSLLGVALVKSIYSISTWSRTVALVHEHEGIQRALGDTPSVYAAYRFAGKLTKHKEVLDDCISRVLDRLKTKHSGMGENIAIDASDLPAYANGQRYMSFKGRERGPGDFSDPDAAWGHRSAVSTRRGGWFYGFKIHMAACATTGLPLAWEVRPGNDKEALAAIGLLDKTIKHKMPVQTVAMDKGYDGAQIYEGCLIRGTIPVIPLRETKGTKESRLSRFLPRNTDRWKTLYKGRGAVEREFGRLKHEWSLLPLKIRGILKVALHVDLTILAKLCCALLAP